MFEIKIQITTKSNCLVGANIENFSIGGIDQSTTTDTNGKPVISASSFKGTLRNIIRENDEKMLNIKELIKNSLEELLKKYEKVPETEKTKKIVDKIKSYSLNPKAEYIFGIESLNNMPRLFFTDFYICDDENQEKNNYFIIETKNSLEEKDGDIISKPRTYRVVRPGIRFQGKISFHNPYFTQNNIKLDSVVNELKIALDLFNHGIYRLGNSKSRGYGLIEVKINN